MVMECFLRDLHQDRVQHDGRKQASLADTTRCLEDTPPPPQTDCVTVQEDCCAGVFIQRLDGLNQSFLHVEASEDLPQACMPDSVRHILEACDVVEQIALVLSVLLYDVSTVEGLFYSALASKTYLFCQQFLGLCPQSVGGLGMEEKKFFV